MKTRILSIVCAGVIGVAGAADIPHRKPGLWEMTVTDAEGAGGKGIKQRICLDAKSEELLNRQSIATGQEACSSVQTRATGDQLRAKAVCNLGSVKMTSESVTTFTGDSASMTTVHTTYDPPLAGRSQSDTRQEAKWLGACPADMKPGDVVLQTGGKHPHEMRTSLSEMFRQHP